MSFRLTRKQTHHRLQTSADTPAALVRGQLTVGAARHISPFRWRECGAPGDTGSRVGSREEAVMPVATLARVETTRVTTAGTELGVATHSAAPFEDQLPCAVRVF